MLNDSSSIETLPTVLNLGSGRKRRPNALNVDVVAGTGPDVVHNLNQRPWPIPSGQFTEVYLNDVLEHLDDVTATMEEIHRVCTDGATVHITVPHYSCSNAFTDPTHRHYFGYRSLDYYTGLNEFGFYSTVSFTIQARAIVFAPSCFNSMVLRLANRFPEAYERRWAWIAPAWFLYFQLSANKQAVK